jgi:ubiquinone/menaquinone biosynthesis C-methylase UbiE
MHWDHYWNSTKSLSSFGDSQTLLGYPEDILAFWENIVFTKGNDFSYLDLATGKGALAIWLQSLLIKHSLTGTVAGCDLANIEKNKITSKDNSINNAIEKVEFKFNTLLEALPYEDNSFDVLVSQFGFEYSDWNKSLPEALRVLKEEGEMILMIHHPNSSITNDCRSGVNILSRILDKNIFDKLIDVVNLKLTGENTSYENHNKAIINEIQSLEINTEDERVWFIDVMSKISNIMINLDLQSINNLISLKGSVNHQIDRLNDQLSVAFDESEIRAKIASSGIKSKKISIENAYVDKALFSWKVLISIPS